MRMSLASYLVAAGTTLVTPVLNAFKLCQQWNRFFVAFVLFCLTCVLADRVSLLHEAAEGQRPPKALLHAGKKINTLAVFTEQTALPTLFLYWHWCVGDHLEYWHPGASGRAWEWGSNWSPWNLFHIPLRQIHLPQRVQLGLDERCLPPHLLT